MDASLCKVGGVNKNIMKIYLIILSFLFLSCSNSNYLKESLIGCWVDVNDTNNVLKIDKDSFTTFNGTKVGYYLLEDSMLTLTFGTLEGLTQKISVLNEDSMVLEPTFFSLKSVLIKKACDHCFKFSKVFILYEKNFF